MQAIPTVYRGIQMRSRLEAKWAAFFDLIGWQWDYEALDLNGWIPDFVVRTAARPLLIEIKPAFDFDERAAQKIERALGYHPDFCDELSKAYEVLLLGLTPQKEHVWQNSPSLGWISDGCSGVPRSPWDQAMLIYPCKNDGMFGIAAAIGDYTDRISGLHDGDRYMCPVYQDDLDILWAQATNAVQWKAPR